MPFDTTIKTVLAERAEELESHFDADVGFFYGNLHPGHLKTFRDFLEKFKDREDRERLVLFVNSAGGSVEAAEKMVEMMRFHYGEVFFVVPDFALSAGTILCMSGDKIFMDYSSSLGPIDPQVFNGREWVPALGYLDKVQQLIDRARAGTISEAEYLILKDQDLATLSRYEQAKDLTVTLLKRWLVQYKFKDWAVHRTNPESRGRPVTPQERQQRAEDIARLLGNNQTWHSHARMIGIETLRSECRLEIDDYSTDVTLRSMIRSYNDLLTDYTARMSLEPYLHSVVYVPI